MQNSCIPRFIFNDRCLTWHSSHENSELHLNLYNTIQSFNLVQVINTPTRLSSTTNLLLDSPALLEDSGIWPPISSSDHCTVYCKIKLRIERVKLFEDRFGYTTKQIL